MNDLCAEIGFRSINHNIQNPGIKTPIQHFTAYAFRCELVQTLSVKISFYNSHFFTLLFFIFLHLEQKQRLL